MKIAMLSLSLLFDYTSSIGCEDVRLLKSYCFVILAWGG